MKAVEMQLKMIFVWLSHVGPSDFTGNVRAGNLPVDKCQSPDYFKHSVI